MMNGRHKSNFKMPTSDLLNLYLCIHCNKSDRSQCNIAEVLQEAPQYYFGEMRQSYLKYTERDPWSQKMIFPRILYLAEVHIHIATTIILKNVLMQCKESVQRTPIIQQATFGKHLATVGKITHFYQEETSSRTRSLEELLSPIATWGVRGKGRE